MEAQMTFDWRLDGRAMLGTQAPTPLESPVPAKHSKTNYSLVAAIVVLMVLAIGAIFCCCYQWEGQLRGQARAPNARNSAHADGRRFSEDPLQDPGGVNQQGVSSFSVLMPGDDVPRFVAWAVPRGRPIPSDMPEPIPIPEVHRSSGKVAHNSEVALQSCIPGGVPG